MELSQPRIGTKCHTREYLSNLDRASRVAQGTSPSHHLGEIPARAIGFVEPPFSFCTQSTAQEASLQPEANSCVFDAFSNPANQEIVYIAPTPPRFHGVMTTGGRHSRPRKSAATSRPRLAAAARATFAHLVALKAQGSPAGARRSIWLTHALTCLPLWAS